MDFTTSANHGTAPNGQRKHTNASAPTTRVTDKDMNSVAWEIMEVIKAGVAAGAFAAPLAFDEANPASYSQMLRAINKFIANGLAGIAPDKFAVGWSAYNAATNTLNLLMADGSTLPVDLTPAFADVIADHVGAADPHTQYFKKAGDTMQPNANLNFSGSGMPIFGINGSNHNVTNAGGMFYSSFADVPSRSGAYGLQNVPLSTPVPEAPAPFINSAWMSQRINTGFAGGLDLASYLSNSASHQGLFYRCNNFANYNATNNYGWKRLAEANVIAGTIASGNYAIQHIDGRIEQYFPATASGTILFPVFFPNACSHVFVTGRQSASSYIPSASSSTQAGFYLDATFPNVGAGANLNCSVYAVGY